MNALLHGAFALLAVALICHSLVLGFRLLNDGIAYLEHDRVVMDRAVPVQAAAIAIVAVLTWIVMLRIDPSCADGAGLLTLSVAGAAGLSGVVAVVMHLVLVSDMQRSIGYGRPLFMRDRTPGHASARHVAVRLDGYGPDLAVRSVVRRRG